MINLPSTGNPVLVNELVRTLSNKSRLELIKQIINKSRYNLLSNGLVKHTRDILSIPNITHRQTITGLINGLVPTEYHRPLAGDIADSVYHIYKAKYPKDTVVRKAIDSCYNPNLTDEERRKIADVARAAYAASYAADAADAAYAAYAAAYAASADAAYASTYAPYAPGNRKKQEELNLKLVLKYIPEGGK